jgi:hypothetical protein
MEAASAIQNPSARAIERALRKLKLTGKHEFAGLDDENGNFIQVAGGGVACMLERRTAEPFRHYRAFQEKRNRGFPDGTKLCFSGGAIPMMSNEWFIIDQAIEAFLAFNSGSKLPNSIHWRDISELLDLKAK